MMKQAIVIKKSMRVKMMMTRRNLAECDAPWVWLTAANANMMRVIRAATG